jgi:hypothetical protein
MTSLEAVLPPTLPWDGASRNLKVPADHEWATPWEKSGCSRTPRYDETVAYLRRLDAASSDLSLVSLGRSPEGRELWMMVAARGTEGTPASLKRSGKPIVLAQGCIHAGECDGKDAGLMLLRDLTVTGSKSSLLDRAHLLFVPIFNVDGHERFSAYNRANQRGPEKMGWRTNARNLNLNRDYAKADTPEMQGMIRALREWEPDLYLDLHVTDGEDYQYDITYGAVGKHGYSPAIAGFFDEVLFPAFARDLAAQGHEPGPLVFAVNSRDMTQGIVDWTPTPRFSNGYGDVCHLPTILVENHSLKPYERRVLGTYVLLESCLRTLGEKGQSLRKAIATDRARRPEEVPLGFTFPRDKPPATIDFKGIEARLRPSAAAGQDVVEWTGKPVALTIPRIVSSEITSSVQRPVAYWIPAAWTEVLDRLSVHGVEMEILAASREVEVERLRLVEPRLDGSVFEGRVRIEVQDFEPVVERVEYPAGSARIATDQPLGDLAILLLEPRSADSFFQWGFFPEILQRTEYVEQYAMAPLGDRMLAADPELRKEFEAKLAADSEFAGSAGRRLQWLYERTPYFDASWRVVPVGRER